MSAGLEALPRTPQVIAIPPDVQMRAFVPAEMDFSNMLELVQQVHSAVSALTPFPVMQSRQGKVA
jgi:hypothetical protein